MEATELTGDLLRIPEEVLYGYVFPHLRLNDLLRLRRVCRQIKIYSDDYIRNHFTDQEREINETNYTFKDFLQCNLPASRIYINNTGPEFFQDSNIPEFLRLHASKITHLRIKHFQTCISESENIFFCALVNLEHLELEFTDAQQRKLGYDARTVNGVRVPREPCYFPPNFQNLRVLLLNEIKGSERFDENYGWDFIKFCTNLEHLRHPLYKDSMSIDGVFSHNSRNGPFGCVMNCIENKIKDNPDQPIALKYYDLQHLDENGFTEFAYVNLVLLCYQHNVKLLNVDAHHHGMVLSAFHGNYRQFADPLVSVRNIHRAMMATELSYLEKVVITSIRDCESEIGDVDDDPQWPMLHTLDVTIESDETQGFSHVPEETFSELLDFLFVYVERSQLRNLRIGNDCRSGGRRSNNLPCPRAADITRNCGNLTKLTLSNWMGTNKSVSKFWSGLVHLEEVILEECKMLGDVAFVGKHREDPEFLKLTKLKKFALLGMDSMTKITDLIFHLVFRHLNIKEFTLTSNGKIKSVTINGIRSLLTGNFNNCVEKFRFHGWSLDNTSMEEFLDVKSQFRASHML